MLRESTVLKKVTLKFEGKDEEANEQLTSEIKFYTKMKGKEKKREEKYEEIMKGCEPAAMFADMQNLLEKEEESMENMPVRKFYNNTFNTLLNRAIFALTKKQTQNPNDMQYFTKEGMIKFVAFQLLDSPPDGEIDQNGYGDDDSR